MRKQKNTSDTNDEHHPSYKVIDSSVEQSQLEFEIDRQVKSIRALIRKLKPTERQRYYDGLLSHILSQPVDYPPKISNSNDSFDYANLSFNELSLIKELSMKINELYWLSECEGQS
jgi:hypothetical protein